MKWVRTFSVFAAFLQLWATPLFARSYTGIVQGHVRTAMSEIKKCGLTVLPADHPSLTKPRIPADLAIVSPSGDILAYYWEGQVGFGTHFEFKNPNGGMAHRAAAYLGGLQFSIPNYPGTIAQVTWVGTPQGNFDRYDCVGYATGYLNSAGFRQCVYTNWTRRISAQLCRFGAKSPR